MKLTFKGAIAVAFCVVLAYTACKKNNGSPTPKVASEEHVSSLIAIDVAKAMQGTYGGVSISDGIKPPTRILSGRTKTLNSQHSASLCGFHVDTTVTYKFKSGDTSSTIIGKFDFLFTCSGAFPDGYVVTTDVLNTGKTPSYAFIYAIKQSYTVHALNTSYTLVSLDGSLKSFGDFKFKEPLVDTNIYKPIFQHQTYNLTGLRIDLTNNADIITGTATFHSVGHDAAGSWDYQGSIIFLGNHKATIIINGKPYSADLLTGTVTPI